MMETEEIRKQRRMKFLQKMEAKNKQTQNKYSRSSNSLMNKNIPEQPSPYNANNNTHFDFSNIQSNPNPERAFPHTPTNVNNNKVNDKESNTTNSMYLSKYNTLNRSKAYIKLIGYLKKILLMILTLMHCINQYISIEPNQFIVTAAIVEITSFLILYKINSNIKNISGNNQQEEGDSKIEKMANQFIDTFGFVDTMFMIYNFAYELFTDFSLILLVHVGYFIIYI